MSLTIGRADSGLTVLPRYAIFDLILLAGCYLAVIDRSLLDRTVPERMATPSSLSRAPDIGRAVPLLLVGLIAVQAVVGTYEAFSSAKAWRANEIGEADITANMDRAPNTLVQEEMGSVFMSAPFIRRMTSVARADRLSLFGTELAPDLERSGLTVDRTLPVTYIANPLNGSTVHNKAVLAAYAFEPYGISRVVFKLRDRTENWTSLGDAAPTYYGWILRWNSADVQNGRYMITCTSYDTIGSSTTSRPVVIRVDNS